jgi:hypothetical protein
VIDAGHQNTEYDQVGWKAHPCQQGTCDSAVLGMGSLQSQHFI